jgi:hypothetical protein
VPPPTQRPPVIAAHSMRGDSGRVHKRRRGGGRRRDVVHSERVAVLVAASRHGHAGLEEHVLGRLPAGKITD